MKQKLLFEADDRSEREQAWLFDLNAPATKEDLREFFRKMRELLDQPEGRNSK